MGVNNDSVSVQEGQYGTASTATAIPLSTDAQTKSGSTLSALHGTFRNTFSSLYTPRYLIFWLGMVSFMAATQMQLLARGYLVYDITGSGTVLGYVNLGIAVPMLIIPFFGGAIADRFDRISIIQGAQLVGCVLALVVGILINTNMVAWPHLMVASMIQGGLFAFMMPARQAIIPHLVSKEQLPNALALNAAGISATTMTAPALAGWLYAGVGPWNVYYVIAGLALTAVVLTTFIPRVSGAPVKKTTSMASDIVEGFVYIWQKPILLVLIMVALVTTILAMPFRFILPVFVVDVYKQGPESMGLLVGLMGAGAMVGALYVASIGRRNRGVLLIMSSFLSAAGLILIALIPIYSAAAVMMLMLGLGDSGRMSLNQSLLIEEADDQYRGRVMSIYMLNFGLMPLGTFPAGVLSDFLGGQTVVGIMGFMLLFATFLIFITQRQLRRLQ